MTAAVASQNGAATPISHAAHITDGDVWVEFQRISKSTGWTDSAVIDATCESLRPGYDDDFAEYVRGVVRRCIVMEG